MLDLLQGTSAFNADTSTFDATSLDENIRSISAVERTWRSPALPDAVKLDLAALPGVNSAGLTGLLQGIDSDFNDEVEDPPIEEEPPPVEFEPLDDSWERSSLDDLFVVLAGVAGEPAPTAPTVDANKLFKKEAIERGYLERPANGVVDSVWSPELNSIRWEMAMDDYDRTLRGDRYGATSMSSVAEMIGKWTSPGGLLAAATELDLFWDYGALKREWNSWGDKWREVGDSSNPLDFAKNLVDAVTGPIDDLVMPIVNWALLGSGVGAFAAGARIGVIGGRALRMTNFIDRLYAPAALTDLMAPSMTALRLQRSSGAARRLGRRLAGWRAMRPVAQTKRAVGVGMRLGATSQLQDLLPGYQGGRSLSDVEPIGAAADSLRATVNSPKFLPVELAFAPQNIFLPGTFLGRASADGANILGAAGRGAVRALGTTTGRAATGALVGGAAGAALGDDRGDVLEGAAIGGLGLAALPTVGNLASKNLAATQATIGAGLGATTTILLDEDPDGLDLLKGAAIGGAVGSGLAAKSSWAKFRGKNPTAVERSVGFIADAAKKLDYKPLAENQQVSSAFDRALRRRLAPEQLAVYDAGFSETNSQLGAYARLLGTTEDQAAASMAFYMKAAAIDRAAEVQATAAGKFDRARYHLYRDKLTAQSRMFDLSGKSEGLLLDEAAKAYAWANAANRNTFTAEYTKILDKWKQDPSRAFAWMADHNEQARKLNRQLLSPEVLTDLDGVGKETLAMSDDAAENLGVLEAYLMQDVEFMRWNEFTTQTAEIARFDADGLLDAAQLMPAYSWSSGKQIGYKGYAPPARSHAELVDSELMSTIFRSPDVDTSKLLGGRLAPLARLNPQGRFTVMRAETKTAGQLVELRRELKDLLSLHESLDTMAARGSRVDTFEAAVGRLADLDDDAVRGAIKSIEADVKITKPAQRVARFARRLGMSGTELRDHVASRIDELLADADLWSSSGVSRFARDGDEVLSGLPALKARIKQLDEAVQYTAAEIDMDGLARYYDEIGDAAKAEEVRTLAEGLKRDGYKLVHGVEFQMPHDLVLDEMHFGDMTTQNMHAATLGNFFRGRLPAQARAIEERRQRVALASTFQERGLTLAPDDDATSTLLADMRQILEDHQATISAALRDAPNTSRVQRPLTYIKTSGAPLRLEDLTKRKDMVISGLVRRGWSEAEAEAAWLAVPKFRNIDFKDLGVYAIEARLRSRNQAVDALKVLGGTERFSAARTLAGGAAGAGIAAATADGEDVSATRLLTGAAAGALGAQVVGSGARALQPRAEMMQLGYMADTLVRARDALRFTLSPWFDLSRYTEGLMLGQTASPLRTPSGERFVMPLNSSPTALKRKLARNPVKLEDGTNLTFERIRAEFQAAAKGDFDPDVLDEAGKWFAQVGMLGFNPTDWMSTAFGHMRQQGFGADEAYRYAREMYTYGTRGRSAAELSVNYIFFPFSFQKKALTHLGDFLTDDLGRSLILHDMYKTYEILDERYDLDAMWEDHVPVMRNLQRLNLFAFGISPGRFGGINAQALESAGRLALGTVFSPNGVSIRDGIEGAELQKLTRSLLPVVNDVNWMLRDLKEQGHVLFSEAHMTTRAEIREGFNEWNEFKRQMTDTLGRSGYTLSDMHNKPWLRDQKLAYEARRAEIGARYPSWISYDQERIGNRVALDTEKRDRLAAAQADPSSVSAADAAMFAFESELDQIQQRLRLLGYDVGGRDGWSDAPPDVYNYIIARGVELRESVPGWQSVWEKFYRPEWGLLEAKI